MQSQGTFRSGQSDGIGPSLALSLRLASQLMAENGCDSCGHPLAMSPYAIRTPTLSSYGSRRGVSLYEWVRRPILAWEDFAYWVSTMALTYTDQSAMRLEARLRWRVLIARKPFPWMVHIRDRRSNRWHLVS